jgi:hypothetical protein
VNVLDIPGYADAIAQERFIRDAAFLGVTETVAGFELKPFTLRHKLVLRAAKNPLVTRETPEPGQLAQFLWVTSAEYSTDQKAFRSFMRRCRKFVPPAEPMFLETKRWWKRFDAALLTMAKTLTEAREYLAEAMMDSPPQNSRLGFKPDYYSEVAFWVSLFNYQYTAEQVLDMPLKVLYQFLNEAKDKQADPRKPALLFNPSDKVRIEALTATARN